MSRSSEKRKKILIFLLELQEKYFVSTTIAGSLLNSTFLTSVQLERFNLRSQFGWERNDAYASSALIRNWRHRWCERKDFALFMLIPESRIAQTRATLLFSCHAKEDCYKALFNIFGAFIQLSLFCKPSKRNALTSTDALLKTSFGKSLSSLAFVNEDCF